MRNYAVFGFSLLLRQTVTKSIICKLIKSYENVRVTSQAMLYLLAFDQELARVNCGYLFNYSAYDTQTDWLPFCLQTSHIYDNRSLKTSRLEENFFELNNRIIYIIE